MGSGATRTWPPPWPPRGPPPPAGQSRRVKVKTRSGAARLKPQSAAPPVYPPRWSWPLRSQSGFPRLPLPLRSPSPSWSSCPPSCHSQPFLSAGGATKQAVSELNVRSRPAASALGCEFTDCRCLTFAAFLAFGSGLGWTGFCERTDCCI